MVSEVVRIASTELCSSGESQRLAERSSTRMRRGDSVSTAWPSRRSHCSGLGPPGDDGLHAVSSSIVAVGAAASMEAIRWRRADQRAGGAEFERGVMPPSPIRACHTRDAQGVDNHFGCGLVRHEAERLS